jgi:uncharacterized protein (TIRG00374 family)
MSSRVNRWIKFGLSLAITVACMWWTFKDTHWAEMWISLKSANHVMLVPYLLLFLVIHVARTLRWGNLLSGIERVPFARLNEAAAIGFMMLIILPFRLGEFARPLLLAQRSTIRRSAAMTSVVLERIIDGLVIAVLLRGLLFFLPGETVELQRIRLGANLMFAVFFSGLLFLAIARWQHDRVVGFMRATLGRVSRGFAEKLIHMVDGFVGALKQLPDGPNLLKFIAFSAVYWGVNGWGMSMLANAFDCSSAGLEACQPLHLTVFQGFVVLCVLIIGIMIPAAPGSAGTFQAFILLGLSVFVPSSILNASGVAYANVMWVIQMSQQIVTGLIFMTLSKTSFSDVAGRLAADSSAEAEAAADAAS